LKIININQFDLNVTNEVTRSANNLEVALALDITGSMKGQPLTDLKTAAKDMVDMIVQDVQTPYYTKLAIAPYAASVNVGGYATSIRGAIIGPKTITGAAWQKPWPDGTTMSKNISGASKANPGVITATAHGLVAGEKIWISGVSGMTQLNNHAYIVGTVLTANTFQLKKFDNTNLNTSTGYSTYSSSGIIRKCVVTTVGVDGCEVQVTSVGHGFANNDYLVISGVVGMTQINTGNNATWQISGVTTDTFNLASSNPSGSAAYSAYTSGGNAYCTVQGCEWLRFTSGGGPVRVFPISTCASERTADAFTDVSPTTSPLHRTYPAASPMASSTNPCVGQTILPLSTDKAALKAQIDSFAAAGSTAGHLGVAWAWYLVSPNFGSLWPASSAPAAYGTDHLFKVVVLMTDGAFNTGYCNGVISQDSTSGSGSANDHINCNSPNGSAFTQAQTLCTNMKAPGNDVIVYTVGFNVGSDPNAQLIMNQCATDAEHAYFPETGAELKMAFQLIAQEISQLRLSQ